MPLFSPVNVYLLNLIFKEVLKFEVINLVNNHWNQIFIQNITNRNFLLGNNQMSLGANPS